MQLSVVTYTQYTSDKDRKTLQKISTRSFHYKEYLRIYSSRHCRQNLWPHLVRTGSFDGRKHIMQWRSSSGGLINCSSWPEGTERLFGTSAIAEKTVITSYPGSSRFPIWRQQCYAQGREGAYGWNLRLPWEIFFGVTTDDFKPFKNVKKNAIFFKLFWYKVFVHWKLKLLNFLVDSVLIPLTLKFRMPVVVLCSILYLSHFF